MHSQELIIYYLTVIIQSQWLNINSLIQIKKSSEVIKNAATFMFPVDFTAGVSGLYRAEH